MGGFAYKEVGMDDDRTMPTFGELLETLENSKGGKTMDEDEKKEITEEETPEGEEVEEVEEIDYKALYDERGEELDKLHREVTDLKRDKDELQRKLNDATKAFAIIADRLGKIDLDVAVEDNGYVETISEDDLDKYISY